MSTAAVVAQLAVTGTEQVGIVTIEVGPWIILGLGLVLLAVRWLLRRKGSVPFPAEEDGEVIDDALPMFFTHKPSEDRNA